MFHDCFVCCQGMNPYYHHNGVPMGGPGGGGKPGYQHAAAAMQSHQAHSMYGGRAHYGGPSGAGGAGAGGHPGHHPAMQQHGGQYPGPGGMAGSMAGYMSQSMAHNGRMPPQGYGHPQPGYGYPQNHPMQVSSNVSCFRNLVIPLNAADIQYEFSSDKKNDFWTQE